MTRGEDTDSKVYLDTQAVAVARAKDSSVFCMPDDNGVVCHEFKFVCDPLQKSRTKEALSEGAINRWIESHEP